MANVDYLGSEKISKLIIKFSVPCILSLLLTTLYNIVDQIFIGTSYIGINGNAATGAVFPLTVLVLGFAQLFGDGASTHLTTKLGKGSKEGIDKIVANALMSSLIVGILLMVIYYACGDMLLKAIGAQYEVLSLAHDYAFIIYAMVPIYCLEFTLVSIVRADGAPRYALIAMFAGAIFNIAGDPIAIYVCKGGMQGAAIATIGGQFLSMVMLGLYLLRSKTFKLKLSSFRFDASIQKENARLGLSSFITQAFLTCISFTNNRFLAQYGADFGMHNAEILAQAALDPRVKEGIMTIPQVAAEYGASTAVGAFVVVMKLFTIVLNIALGLIIGALPVIGYNYGAKKIDRVKKIFKTIFVSNLVISLIFLVLFETLPRAFIGIFGGLDDPIYTEFATGYLRIYLSTITLVCTQKICALFTQVVGKTKVSTILSVLRDGLLIVSIVVTPLILSDAMHATPDRVHAMFYTAPIADVIAILITAPIVIYTLKRLGASNEIKEKIPN